MEKIAIISDIHGNITALNALLEDIEKRGIKRIFCLGDMIIKCSSPYECAKILLEKCEVVLKGNCELRAVEDPRISEHYWNKDKLSDEQKDKIKKLPLFYDFYMSGLKFRIMHSSPESIMQRSFYWDFNDGFCERAKDMFKSSELFGNLKDKVEPDVVIFAHIHRPMILRLENNKTLINPGAVSNTSDIINVNGKQYTYGSYLIIDGEYESKEISPITYNLVKFTYDTDEEAKRILATDMPNKEVAALELTTGQYFDRKGLHEEACRKESMGESNAR